MPASCSVFLNVQDIERSLSFYESLGFRVAKRWKDDSGKTAWADLGYQGADLGLGHIPSNDDPAFRAWVGTPLGAGVIVYFTVPNVDKAWEKAQAAKATVEMPLTDRPYGRMFTLNDPDGYTISFVTEPKKRPVKKAAAKRQAARQIAKTGKKGRAKTPAGKSVQSSRLMGKTAKKVRKAKART